MNYNYHTHTTKCHHASGTEREYIEQAVKNGIKYMGFSDHAPFVLPNGDESYYRVQTCETEKYFSDIIPLREEYKDVIDIKIGFEMEYYPDFFDDMLKYVTEVGAEYLILGQHFLRHELSGLPSATAEHTDEALLKEYADTIISGIKSGCFTYIAHPDMFNFIGDEKIYDKEMRRICRASSEYNIPLEVNFLGMRGGRHYPCDKFWKIVGEEHSPAVFGLDAHQPEHACAGETLELAKEFVKKHNLNYIGKPNLILLQKN